MAAWRLLVSYVVVGDELRVIQVVDVRRLRRAPQEHRDQ
jgi:hypothetical protein